ncbi:MAG: Hpt domain-containing protein [Betaproteobacteria bacterium]|nr:Hpt domain-containing protein [Betaproteobacteria bacterium]
MSAQPSYDVAPLTWVKGEIDQALAAAGQFLEQFAADPRDRAPLAGARGHLHQVTGVLNMVGLQGPARFNEELESLVKAIEAQAIPEGCDAIGESRKAVASLASYLDRLIHGEPNVPVRLFPMLRAVAEARGATGITPGELFFPDLTVSRPGGLERAPLSGPEWMLLLKSARSRFQRGLLPWLKASDGGGAREMAEALRTLAQAAAPDGQRTFWWVTAAFMDAVAHQGVAADLQVKQLAGRIDHEMRRLAEGGTASAERLLRDLLYHLARSAPVTDTVREVHQAFHLKALLPGDQRSPDAELAAARPVLAQMQELTAAAKEAWDHCASGGLDALNSLLEHTARLKQMATGLKHPALEKLISVIGAAGVEVRNHPERLSENLAIEMATGFLLVEHAIAQYANLDAEFADQVEAVVARVKAAALGQWNEAALPAAPRLDDASRRSQELELLAQLTHEIEANLKQAEQVLDGFFRDHSKRAELPWLEPVIKQVMGTFSILGLERPVKVLDGCQSLITRFANPEQPVNHAELELLAEGMSSVGFYARTLHHEQPDESLLDAALARFGIAAPAGARAAPAVAEVPPATDVGQVIEEIMAAPAPAVKDVPEPVPAEVAAIRDQASDPDLLEVFLEEAREVLTNIRSGAATCATELANRDALATVRRGFHTLKGSGRMVGLKNMGEVAWALEQVMNKWLEERKPATTPLLDLVAQAADRFGAWVESLRGTGHADVAAGDLVAAAHLLRTGTPLPAKPVPETTQRPVTPPTPAAPMPPAQVVIGSTIIPRDLFTIFRGEADMHLATLARQQAQFAAGRGARVPEELPRAVHTLAGIARTTGLTFISDLAGALEEALAAISCGELPPEDATLAAIDRSVTALSHLLAAVGEERLPAPDDLARAGALIRDFESLIETAKANPVTTEITAAEAPPEPVAVLGLAPVAAVATPAPAVESVPPQPAAKPHEPKERRAIRDDLDPALLPIFLEEAQELVPMIGAELRAWRASPQDAQAARLLQRSLHTLKGSARMAGAMRLGELTHKLESRVESSLAAGTPDAAVFDTLDSEFDRLCGQIEGLQKGPEQAAAAAAPMPAAAATPQAAQAPEGATLLAAEQELLAQQAVLRVKADLVDRLVNEAGEVAIARSRIEAEAHRIKQSLLDLMENVSRLKHQLREIEIQAESQMQSRMDAVEDDKAKFDPLEFDRFTRLQELTRAMAESVADVAAIQQNLQRNLDETEKALSSQARTGKELQQELMRVRAVPVGNYSERFHRTVRQAARDLGKKARLAIEGATVELDRGVLERVTSPIEHMLRNSVAHGIEAAEARAAAGKPDTGEIKLTVRQEGNEVAIVLADDGAGLNLERIRHKAEEKGLLQPGQEIDDAKLAQFIFSQGFSTATEVTQVSGRGVGMDVVRGEITALGGRVEVTSSPGRGTAFTVYLPLTLAVAQVVLASAGGGSYAVPSAMVEQVREYGPDEIAGLYRARSVELHGNSYPFFYLPRLMGDAVSRPEPRRYNTVLFLKRGAQRVAVHVDESSGNQEVVIKNIGRQLSGVPGIEGATVLGDGLVVLIVNPVQLSQREDLLGADAAAPDAPAVGPVAAPVVMVVDDSLTVRKITGRLLAREGYQVMTAKDGVDALEQIAVSLPDVMLVDIEMPRMDGFDLTRRVRTEPRTADVPIIMITSRTAEKHRNYARELGVNVYLGKPFQETELLGHIAGFVKRVA